MKIRYDRNAMDLTVEFLRNANPSAEALTSEELRNEIEGDMRKCLENGESFSTRYGYRVTNDVIFGPDYFDITVNLSTCLPLVLVTVE